MEMSKANFILHLKWNLAQRKQEKVYRIIIWIINAIIIDNLMKKQKKKINKIKENRKKSSIFFIKKK